MPDADQDADQDAIDRWLFLAKEEEEWLGDDLFSAVEYLYIEGIAGIDWAESICGGLAAENGARPKGDVCIQALSK